MLLLRVLILFFFINCSVWSQQCDNSRPLSTPDDKFFINDNGTITELESGLTWMRCAVGQTWNGSTCSGNANVFTWKNAFQEEDKINQGTGFAGQRNWHLPNLAELATIVERQCNTPRINLELFPATPAAAFWTANHKSGAEPRALAMDFDKSGLLVMPQDSRLYIRLVSGRE